MVNKMHLTAIPKGAGARLAFFALRYHGGFATGFEKTPRSVRRLMIERVIAKRDERRQVFIQKKRPDALLGEKN